MASPSRSFPFTPAMRLHSKREFDRVFQRRQRAADDWLVVFLDAGADGGPRLGIAVGKRYGNAVQRNRIKRLLRESFRHLHSALPAGTDWVVVPQPAPCPTQQQIADSLKALTGKLIRRCLS